MKFWSTVPSRLVCVVTLVLTAACSGREATPLSREACLVAAGEEIEGVESIQADVEESSALLGSAETSEGFTTFRCEFDDSGMLVSVTVDEHD